jgi:hypothetical protein
VSEAFTVPVLTGNSEYRVIAQAAGCALPVATPSVPLHFRYFVVGRKEVADQVTPAASVSLAMPIASWAHLQRICSVTRTLIAAQIRAK